LMINLKMPVYWHFVVVAFLVWILIWFNFPFLVKRSAAERAKDPKQKLFGKLDPALVQLGIIAFCSMASEGIMFDWSGIYFKDIVKAPPSLVILGYTSFMIMMATGRFLADYLIAKIGRKLLMQICGVLISTGLFTAVFFPFLVPSTIAFMMVGLGVSSIVPTVYSVAVKASNMPPGIAIATVSGVGFLGFLMGPPLIGYISEAAGLRYSFALIGIFGIGISLMVSRVRAFRIAA